VLKPITLISGTFPPEIGGPAKFGYEFALWLNSLGLKVKVITYSEHSGVSQLRDLMMVNSKKRAKSLLVRYCLFIFAIARTVKRNEPVLAIGAFIETFLSSILFRFEYIAKVPGDIVWERARNNKKTILDIYEFQNSKLPLKYMVFRWIYSQSLRRAKYVIVPSMGLQHLCQMWGVSNEKIHLIHNSIESQPIRILSGRIPVFDLLTVCRLTPWKGVDELICYAAEKNLSLVIAGNGPERMNLEKLASDLGANVLFLGEITHDSVTELFLQSRVFVLNSYYEGLPHALIEARGNGIISVARGGTGSEEVINDDVDGLLIRPDRNLMETLNLVLDESFPREIFAKRAREDTRNRFDRETNFSRIRSVLEL
jgi:glycosyltransferase involved in cell wall biosynthesis